jgi:hypothetical protein
MTPSALAKKRAIAMERIVAAAVKLGTDHIDAGGTAITAVDLDGLRRPYGRGVDREANQLDHAARILRAITATSSADAGAEGDAEVSDPATTDAATTDPDAYMTDAVPPVEAEGDTQAETETAPAPETTTKTETPTETDPVEELPRPARRARK